MAIRDDLSVDWSSSPRIITIAAPSTEITMQDLLDTLRDLESRPEALDDNSIVDAGGKEDLGGGVKVGLTIILLNALLAFEARVGPTFTLCRVSGGNLVAKDEFGIYFDSPLYPTDYVYVTLAASSSATMTEPASPVDIANAVLTGVDVETGLNLKQSQRVQLAALAGLLSGAEGTNVIFKNAKIAGGGTKNRIVAAVDEYGNRSVIVLDVDDE